MARSSARNEHVLSEKHSFIHPALQARGQLHTPAALPPGKKPGTHYLERWVGPKGERGVLTAHTESTTRLCVCVCVCVCAT
jgi:hypothetical protein